MHSFQDGIFSWLSLLTAQSAKASLLAGLVALLCLLPRRWLSSPWRHLLWCAVFVRLMLPDVPVPGWSWNISRVLPETVAYRTQVAVPASAQTPAPFDEPPSPVPALEADETNSPVTSPPSFPSTPSTPSLSWPGILGMLWLGGALTWWCALGVGAWRFRRLLACASQARPQTQALLRTCLDEAEVRTPVRVKCLDHLAAPAVCGVLRPVILIPKTVEAAMSPQDLRLLLLHELGHVKRCDTSVQVVASLLLGLHWWNPVLWFAWGRLRHESEAATDAWVLQTVGAEQAPSYGAMILDLAARTCAAGISLLLMPTLMSATSHGKKLRQRLAAITGFRLRHKRAAILGLAAVVILALTGFSQNAPVAAAASETQAPAISANIVGGIVVDEQGKPIPGAKIELNLNRPKDTLSKSALPQGPLKPEFTETDATGHWHFDDVPAAALPETLQDAVGNDTYRLYITHPDFLLGEFSGTGSELGSNALFRQQSAKLTLTRGHIIRGVVRDEKGHGIAGATIERNVNARHGADPKAITDANGSYVLKAARPGDFVVRARADGFALQQQRVILTADDSLDFTLKPAHMLTLKFRDAQGQPLTKGYVNFMPVLKPWLNSDRLWVGKPDQDGAVIWKEAPGGEIIAVVHMDGCERLDQTVPTDQETVITPKASPPLPLLTIRVKAVGTGKPLSGCIFDTALVMRDERVHLFWMEDKIHAPLKPSATEGEYTARIPKFSKDPMAFRVRCPGYAPAMTAPMDPAKGNAALEVSLQERAPLTLTVLKADGSPASHRSVNVIWSGSGPLVSNQLMGNPHLMTDFVMNRRHPEFSGTTGEDGRCVLPPCADEAYVIVANDSGYALSDYGHLVKDSTLRLQPYRKSEDVVARPLLSFQAGESVLSPLHVRLMREGKPVLDQKRGLMLRCSDNKTTSAATFLPIFVEQGVAMSGERLGTTMLQMALQSPDGNYWFSPVLTARMKAGETTEVTANFEPGIRVAGRLADEVPRPVKDALIHAYVTSADGDIQNKLLWTDLRPVREDGSFEFPSLPSGNVRFLVLADGWMSPLFHEEGGKNRPWSAGRILHPRDDIVVPMQRTASCEVTVTDAEGKAVPDAAVWMSAFFSPDGFAHGLMQFGGPRNDMLYPSTSLGEIFAFKLPFIGNRFDRFKILTDAQGHAVIQGLPSLADLGKINGVAPGLDPHPAHKLLGSAQVDKLQPGETAKVTVRLEKEEKEK